jgi:hypothetical protein
MNALTVRFPGALVAAIEAESRERHRSRPDVVRERLSLVGRPRRREQAADLIADREGSVAGSPRDLSARRRAYLEVAGYGRKRAG